MTDTALDACRLILCAYRVSKPDDLVLQTYQRDFEVSTNAEDGIRALTKIRAFLNERFHWGMGKSKKPYPPMLVQATRLACTALIEAKEAVMASPAQAAYDALECDT